MGVWSRTMKKKIIFIAIFVVVIGVLVGVGIPQIVTKTDDTYSGKIVFNSEDEYSQFKQALIQYDATWQNDQMQVLSSEPPIIVQYTVSISRDKTFPYGVKHSMYTKPIVIVTIGVLFCLIMLYALMSGEKDMDWLFK